MISVTILTLNAQKHLLAVLEAVRSFDDVVILDAGSTDQTKIIANLFPNVRWIEHDFQGFGPAHNKAAQLAVHDWILSIDADEVPSSALVKEIHSLFLDPKSVYDIPFHNIFRGKWIKWCGWYPESHVRLYHRHYTSFTNDFVHEKIGHRGLKVQKLIHPICHYSYETFSDFLIKMERYSSLFAKQNKGKKKASIWTAIGHSLGAFFKSFVLKKGFLGGVEGFVISTYNAHTAFYKYLKLYELNATTCLDVPQGRQRETCQFPRSAD